MSVDESVTEQDLDRLAFKFLKEFARIECALKASGFHNGDGDAKANWDTFANSIANNLENDSHLSNAIDYMSRNPPKKQVIANGILAWDTASVHPHKTHELLLCVRRVRNNLFHGGKFNGHWFAPERSRVLIQHSLSILEACLKNSSILATAYDDVQSY